MAEYIEREKLIEHLRKDPLFELVERYGITGVIESIPAADVRPVVRGRWIDRDDDYYGWNMWSCSSCGEEFVLTDGTPDMNEYHFCPNCGAWMGENEEVNANDS